jgi:MarR family transcriptional regulator for hemolysin
MKPSESLAVAIAQLSRVFEHELRAALMPSGVTPGQLPVLLALFDSDGPTQAELARALAVEQPTMAATLARMERDDLVERRPDPHDGRRARVHLTERSRALRVPLIDAARGVNRRAVRGLSAEQRSVLYQAVDRATANLGTG